MQVIIRDERHRQIRSLFGGLGHRAGSDARTAAELTSRLRGRLRLSLFLL
jgi:hypothetical protein